ncbi:MAG: alpha/beta hydrolase fold domain-containing protein [Bacteroidales bacterium]|nr:alpha/beta hydrolase fold domain-containing protein [Bacteroidales bacterium]MBN2818690.1 alpha/beta hydrolase fold domain-containing protein [Bacteroidales bacterium]
MRFKIMFFTLCLFLPVYISFSQDYKTITFFNNDTLELKLDVFIPENEKPESVSLLIFVHGGGFKNGNRNSGHKFCREMTSRGLVSASISYTLYMKDKNFGCDGILSEKIKAIQHGTNALWLATDYFIKHADEYHIDTNRIFIAGNSAGAEVALHSAYWDRKIMSIYPNQLSVDFKFAGIISGSGAIMDLNLITKNNVVPTFLFHGDGDKLVPYATAPHHFCKTNAPGWLMLFGSKSIYDHLVLLDCSATLYTLSGSGHEIHSWYFENKPDEIYNFINNDKKNRVQNHTQINVNKRD